MGQHGTRADHEADHHVPLRAWVWGGGAALISAALFFMVAVHAPGLLSGKVLYHDFEWAPSLGIGARFMLDGLALMFGLLITGIGTLIFIFATGYMGAHPQFPRLILSLLAFMLSMLGLVTARDLIGIFVFWELTSVTSWLLIGFDHENPRARRNALQAMLVTGAGGLALMAGLILMGMAAGTQDLAEILAGEGLQGHAPHAPILVLVLLGAFTKSAQWPFHFWLPNAMAAPTPVSAYLHSATMVKAGIYLLARLSPTLGGTEAWSMALMGAGLVTAIWASLLALRQSDLKQALACTTLMALGTITALMGLGTAHALSAAMAFLVVHALYKAALFMVVGGIDHATGTREVLELGGLRRAMPVTAGAALLAAASMAGIPLMFGWLAKEVIYAASLEAGAMGMVVGLGLLIANALMFAVAFVVGLCPFMGRLRHTPREAHENAPSLWLGPVLLAALGLLFGLMPGLVQPLISVVVEGALAADHAAELHLWGGVNAALLMSLATFALGAVLWRAQAGWRRGFGALADALPSLDRGWDRFLDGFRAFASGLTARIQTGSLPFYLSASMAVVTLTLLGGWLARHPVLSVALDAPWLAWGLAGLMLAGTALMLVSASRIAIIGGLGTVGIAVAMVFISFGAPDVATTQLMVEALTSVLFGVALLRLPAMRERRSRSRKLIDGVIAGGLGLGVTLIILGIASHPLDRHLTTWFEQNALSEAHGRNIVNVILVDFRAFDTFGELTVVLLASIGAFALLRRRIRRSDT